MMSVCLSQHSRQHCLVTTNLFNHNKRLALDPVGLRQALNLHVKKRQRKERNDLVSHCVCLSRDAAGCGFGSTLEPEVGI